MAGFYVVDYVIFVAIFVACIAIGIYHGCVARRKGATTSAYLMGDRKLSLFPVTVSMVVSVMSANTMLGVPAETYNFGIQIVLKAFGTAIGAILAAIVFVPLLYPLKITSTYEYLEMRFQSKWVRRLGSVLLIIAQCLYIGCVIVGSSVALQTAVGLPSWASILIITVLGSLDTAVGGFKGVIWTDVFQSVIMLAGLVAVLTKGIVQAGGVDRMWTINQEWGRIFINLESDVTQRMNLLSGLVGFAFTWWAFYGVSQPQVQRFCAVKSRNASILSLILNPFGFSIFHVLSVCAGLVLVAYYVSAGCDPIRAKYITNSNQLLIYFVMDALDLPGLSGAFVACLFCAALSSQSSSLNSMAAVLWEDFLSDKYSHWSDSKKSYFLRCSVLVIGAVCGLLAIVMILIGGNLQQLAISFYSFSLGPLLGMFLLGAFVPFANSKGAFWGGLISLILNGWLLGGQTVYKSQRLKLPAPTHNCTGSSGYPLFNTTTTASTTPWPPTTGTTGVMWGTNDVPAIAAGVAKTGVDWLYSVSFMWYGMIGCVLTLLIGIVISLVTGCERKRKIPKRLFSFIIHPFLGGAMEEEDCGYKDLPHGNHGNDPVDIVKFVPGEEPLIIIGTRPLPVQ